MEVHTNYINCCFPIGNIGGLDSVMLREATILNRKLICLAPDTPNESLGLLEYKCIDDLSPGLPDRWDLWFGVGFCQLIFPEAYTSPYTSMNALNAMYKADINRESIHEIGSLERLLEYVDLYAPDWEIARYFTKRFEREILNIPNNSIMNWQSFFMEPAINDYADILRDRNIFQTFHLHEALPNNLHLTTLGQRFIQALTKVDEVYLHTDEFVRRLECQIEILKSHSLISVNSMPKIKRFDLGIDLSTINDTKLTTNSTILAEKISSLNISQKILAKESLDTIDSVPNRFVCLDRADPVKGLDIVLYAIEKLLDEQLSSGKNLNQIRDEYRFFFIQKSGNETNHNPYNQAKLYNEYIENIFVKLENKFPGIIFRCDPFGREHRLLLFAIIRGCHGITGGTTEGLNLSIMEIAKINEDFDTTIICGQGAGFAMQLNENQLASYAYLPKQGSVIDFYTSIKEIISVKKNNPGQLKANKKKVIAQEIDTRKDSVIVSPKQ